MTLNDMVHSQLFLRPECRAIILPVVVKRVKELLTGPQEVRLCYLQPIECCSQ